MFCYAILHSFVSEIWNPEPAQFKNKLLVFIHFSTFYVLQLTFKFQSNWDRFWGQQSIKRPSRGVPKHEDLLDWFLISLVIEILLKPVLKWTQKQLEMNPKTDLLNIGKTLNPLCCLCFWWASIVLHGLFGTAPTSPWGARIGEIVLGRLPDDQVCATAAAYLTAACIQCSICGTLVGRSHRRWQTSGLVCRGGC